MRAVVQRVLSAKVVVDDATVGEIQQGLLVFLGVEEADDEGDLEYLVKKVIGLRVFSDSDGKMNLDLPEIGGQLLVVSQFTLLGDVRKGRRPSFIRAASQESGRKYYRAFIDRARQLGVVVAEGQFQADMRVSLINDGPVTLLLDSRKQF